MTELQLARMEREAPRGIALRAIFSISDNRMTDRGQLNADLMLAPAFQRELEQRLVTAFLQHSIMRDRQLATLRDPANDQRAGFHQMIFQRSLRRRRRSLHECQIFLGDVFPTALESALHGFVACEYHEAGGLAIKAVHDECLLHARLSERLEMFVEHPMRDSLLLALGTHRK